ncbi:MAG: hypothetical protein N3A00_03055 [Thermodesulfovibrio sp.]|nr:hypothetical protein [Thermodesulfovibrio sp.]
MKKYINISIFAVALIVLILCGCTKKFDIKDLSKSGKIAIISDSSYRIFYAPSPFAKEKEHEQIIEDLEAFLEGFPLAKILRQKVYKALIDSYSLDLVSELIIEKMEDTYLQNFLLWAKRNNVNAVIHLESTIEVSHAYRMHSLSLRNYPKIWTKIRIIRVENNEVLWTKRVWTHMFDGTTRGLKTYSAYDTVVDRDYLETLINRKIDYVVKAILKSLV